MHKPESVLDDDTHKIVWYFEIQTAHSITARIPDLILVNKKKRTSHLLEFTFLAGYRMKVKESEKKTKKNWINTWTLPENCKRYGT